jgi:chloride channel 7
VVILVEGTGNIEFLIPIILAIVISNWISHHIHFAGAYEADLEALGMVYIRFRLPCIKSQKENLVIGKLFEKMNLL